jgi:hypothetical protein
MPNYASRISQLILDQLAVGERRVLSLVVVIGKVLSRTETFEGDLTAMVKSALRTLVEAGAVVDVDGLYSLAPATRMLQPQ